MRSKRQKEVERTFLSSSPTNVRVNDDPNEWNVRLINKETLALQKSQK
jgi:hypothetical protein